MEAATITPTSSRDNSYHEPNEAGERKGSKILAVVSDNVAMAQKRIQDVENRLAQMENRHRSESMTLLKNQLFAEKVCLVDALVIMGWEHYRCYLEDESVSHELAEAAVRHIYENALDVSIQLFCSVPQSSSPAALRNMDRLMILLLVLDYDEYCETLLQYQLACEYGRTASDHQTISNRRSMEAMLRPSGTGANYLQQLHELWKRGEFDRFDPTSTEEEESFAKIHAAGLCLVLFRKLESMVDRQQTTDLHQMQEQFKVLFDDYLPKQLTQKPSMNNIIATKYARVLFMEDGSPTVYWSLLADSYRREWGEYFDQDMCDGDGYESTDMDTDDDEDDGL